MKGSFWLAWRQQRVPAGIGAAALVLTAAIAAYYRSGMLDALRSGLFNHCATGPLYCTRSDTGLPLLLDVEPLKYLGALNIALPVVIGVFWGAPLLGRDRELGTHRLVLAQGLSRGQWFASRFALAAATTTVLSGLLAGAFAWWWRPAADRSYGLFWYDNTALSGSGPRVVAAALFGLTAGDTAGPAGPPGPGSDGPDSAGDGDDDTPAGVDTLDPATGPAAHLRQRRRHPQSADGR